MFDASFASLATLVACRDSAALSLAASFGSMRGFFSVGCRQYGPAVHFGVADTQVHFLGKEANQMHRAQPAGKGVAASPQPAHSRHSSHLDIAVWLRRHMCWQRWQLIGQVERLQRVAAKASAAASEAAGKANSSTIPVLSQAAQQRWGRRGSCESHKSTELSVQHEHNQPLQGATTASSLLSSFRSLRKDSLAAAPTRATHRRQLVQPVLPEVLANQACCVRCERQVVHAAAFKARAGRRDKQAHQVNTTMLHGRRAIVMRCRVSDQAASLALV
jgi:phenylpyruvate tautomerase PptA (4-oxalocrotonate tautomerase family)